MINIADSTKTIDSTLHIVGKYLVMVFSSSHVRHSFSPTQSPSLISLLFNIKSDTSSILVFTPSTTQDISFASHDIIKSSFLSSTQDFVRLISPHSLLATSSISIGNGTSTIPNIRQAPVEFQCRRTNGIDHEGLSHERIKSSTEPLRLTTGKAWAVKLYCVRCARGILRIT